MTMGKRGERDVSVDILCAFLLLLLNFPKCAHDLARSLTYTHKECALCRSLSLLLSWWALCFVFVYYGRRNRKTNKLCIESFAWHVCVCVCVCEWGLAKIKKKNDN